MSSQLILVTGATGKTGTPLVEQLLERGFAVRALARRHDERSERLAAIGAEVVVGDLLDLQSMRDVMQNVNRAYYCYPPQGDLLVEATTIFAVAAREAGVKAVVNMSQISARDNSQSPLARQHRLSEHILDWAEIGAAHIRPTFFAENLYIFGAHNGSRSRCADIEVSPSSIVDGQRSAEHNLQAQLPSCGIVAHLHFYPVRLRPKCTEEKLPTRFRQSLALPKFGVRLAYIA